MYARAEVRIPLILLFGTAAALSPSIGGWPFIFDGWLWSGLRDVYPWRPWNLVPLIVAGLMVAGDCAGAMCPAWRIEVRRPLVWALAIGAVSAALLWLLRVRRWFGDLVGIDRDPLVGYTLEAAEPLGVFTYYYTVHTGAAMGLSPSVSVAIITVAFGVAAVVALFLWARAVAEEWVLPFAMLACSAFMVIFFGYPEKGTPKALALVTWYIYLGTRAIWAPRAATVMASSAVLALSGLMHGAALVLLPAHAWSIWWRRPWRHAALGVLSFAVPMLVMLAYGLSAGAAGGPVGNVAAPLSWFPEYCSVNCAYKFFSWDHAIDIVNCLLMLAPVATLCWPEALAFSRDPASRWLALAALGGLFLSVTWFPQFGYLPDWDIFAITPLLVSYHAILVGVSRMDSTNFRRLAFAWIVGASLHTASWWRYFYLPL